MRYAAEHGTRSGDRGCPLYHAHGLQLAQVRGSLCAEEALSMTARGAPTREELLQHGAHIPAMPDTMTDRFML